MSQLTITPLDRPTAQSIATWRYPPPYESYNLADAPYTAALFVAMRERGYFQLRDERGELVAFCCFGEEARVPGGDYDEPALDVGIGVRPDLTGRGLGRRYLDAALAFGQARYTPPALRLTVAAFNTRAIRLYTGAGFRAIQHFTSTFGDQPFIVMIRRGELSPSGGETYL